MDVLFRIRAGEEDAILPDDGGGTAFPGEGRGPQGVRFIQRNRQIGFRGGSIEERTPPLRPVLRLKRRGKSQK